jgi:hypothetical protein
VSHDVIASPIPRLPNVRGAEPDEPAIDLALRAATLSEPDAGECLDCYVNRMLALFSCVEDQRFTRAWFARQPQLSRRLRRWMRRLDAAGCDCQVVTYLLDRMPADEKHRALRCPASYRAEQDER